MHFKRKSSLNVNSYDIIKKRDFNDNVKMGTAGFIFIKAINIIIETDDIIMTSLGSTYYSNSDK